MVVEKILGKINTQTDKKVDKVYIEWFEQNKHLLKKVSERGVEIGIKTELPLCDGDILYEDENSIIAVEIKKTDLIKITVNSMKEMGRLCFEIGNRHLSLAIDDNSVTIPYDEPTFSYLKKLGFAAEKVCEKFTGYTECKAHGHSHHHHE